MKFFRAFCLFFLISLSSYAQNWIVYNSSNSGLRYNKVYGITFDKANTAWVGSLSQTLNAFSNGSWQSYTYTQSSSVLHASITIDKNNMKWVSAGNEAGKFDGSTWTFYNSSNSSMPNYSVYCLAVDSSNNKWFGTKGGGLVKYTGSTWTVYTTSNSGLPENSVYSLLADKNGNIWVGTNNYGLCKFDGTTWTNYSTFNSQIPGDNIYSLATDGNNILVGTSSGFGKFDGTTWTNYTVSNSQIPSNYIRAICYSNGDYWIGTGGSGLAKLNNHNAWTTYTKASSGIPGDTVYAVAADKAGSIWAGTLGSGIGVLQLITSTPDNTAEQAAHIAFPNPFSQETTIRMTLGKPGNAVLTVYNTLGQRILVKESLNTASHTFTLNSSQLSPGLYYYTLKTEKITQTGKLIAE